VHFSVYSESTVLSPMTAIQKRKRQAPRRKTARVRRNPQPFPAVTPLPVADIPALPSSPTLSAAQKKRPTQKRVRIGDALRQSGLDEWRIAGGYVGVLDKLTQNASDGESPEKLLVDVLKECSRHLEPPRSPDAVSDGPVTVNLIHHVSRPSRTPTRSS
jgi:hypothetical protein